MEVSPSLVQLGGRKKHKTLIDLGASVNVMPLSIYKKLIIEKMSDKRMKLHFFRQLYQMFLWDCRRCDGKSRQIHFFSVCICHANLIEGTLTLKLYNEVVKVNVLKIMNHK